MTFNEIKTQLLDEIRTAHRRLKTIESRDVEMQSIQAQHLLT